MNLIDRANVALLRAIPAPTAEAPPGSELFTKALNWIFWGATLICVIGFIGAGGAMLFAHSRGEGGEHMKKLGMVTIGSVVIGSAAAFATAATGQ